MDDLFGGGGGACAARAAPAGLRGEALAAVVDAKSRCRRFGEEWHALHALAAALRDSRVRLVPSNGEPEVRKALEAVVTAARAASRLGPAAFERHGVDLPAILAGGVEAEGALRALGGVLVTYGQVADALDAVRVPARSRGARVRAALRAADARPETAPETGADAAVGASP